MNIILVEEIERSTEPLNLIQRLRLTLTHVIQKWYNQEEKKKYFLLFIDDCTRYCHTYLFPSNDEGIEIFKHYKNEDGNQLTKKIKILR